MKTIPLLLLAMAGADFQMLPEPPRDEVSYQMLAEPADQYTHRDGPVQDVDHEETAATKAPRETRSRRLLVYTASWCGPCRRFREEVLPKLEAAGWEIGVEPTDYVQLIAVGTDPPEGIESLPTFVLVEDGRETRRHVGFLDAWGVGELVKGFSERPEPVPPRLKATLPGTVPLPVIRPTLVRPLQQRCQRCGRFHTFRWP